MHASDLSARQEAGSTHTIDCIKELCGAKHIKVYGKTKDAPIKQLLGAGGPEKAEGSMADEEKLPTPTHLMEI